MSNLCWRYNHIYNGTEQAVSPDMLKNFNQKIKPIKAGIDNDRLNNNG